ncbi:phage tail spike protein [uncultured Ruminococcus sp.]|uniref:phage tail spike protein n=1 Tax=uncultured Ruminococcus sp. TaxID=165186 RepID=UPI0025F747D4|nr:phage tail spike protein [uncultured Ruminococcus sp.]
MIPILYKADAVDFSTFGIGALSECTLCEVTEERNGAFECTLKYPVTGMLFAELKNERLIKANPNDTSKEQLFRIYRITTPINGIVTIYAQHISYDLSNIAELMWSSALISPSLAMSRLFTKTATTHNFKCSTDFSSAKPFSVSKPMSVRACLGGSEGSMLDLWGGEYEWDNFNVILHSKRGKDNGVVIEYGKNLTDMEQDNDFTDVYTDILPYAVFSDESTQKVITLSEITLPIIDKPTRSKTLIKDFTEFFEDKASINENSLRNKAKNFIKANPLGVETPTLTVAFEPLWKQPEYSAILERVSLCDTVTIRHSALGITAKSKVIKTVYDSLAEKYVSITLGSAKSNFVNTVGDIKTELSEVKNKTEHFPLLINTAVKNATSLITGQNGGYVVINTNSVSGQPYELLILDAPTIESAVNVWRWNVGGLGFSKNGYNGPYETAITSDGQIVADFITSGSLTANIIKAGVISSFDNSSWWDLESGEVHLKAYASTETVKEINEKIDVTDKRVDETNDKIDAVNNQLDGVRGTISTVIEKTAELQINADKISSTVSSLTTTVETIDSTLESEQERVTNAENKISVLEQTADNLSVKIEEQYVGGMNYIQNSAGLNGMSDDWEYSGSVSTGTSTDISSNTSSNSCFIMGSSSTLSQTVNEIVPDRSYTVSIRARKPYSAYTAYFYIQYNGIKKEYLFNTTDSFDWTDFSVVLPDVSDSSITICAYSRDAPLYISDIMLTDGSIARKWTPAPNEIYTNEVKIDRKGIEVSNSKSKQKTVITNTEFSGYYNNEKIFTLNKDETQTKKTTVDGELTIGKTKFIPMADSSQGLNIVILD